MIPLGIPGKFKFLLRRRARYKGLRGGRGSAKSHSIAGSLITLGSMIPIRVLCTREIQKSIRDSVKRLLDDKINQLQVNDFYDSVDNEIRGANGTLFMFYGLRNNADSIRSIENIDITWIEEAHRISQSSLDTLIPSVRAENSEIWASWNPHYRTDPIDALLCSDDPPPSSIVVDVNYRDNWFLPEVLREEMEYCRQRDPDKYKHVWLGEYQSMSEARVFHNWKVEEFNTEEFEFERFYFGADWGFSIDPTVLVRMFIVGRTLYIDQEVYKIKCPIDYIPALFAGNCPEKNKRRGKYQWENPYGWEGIKDAYDWPIVGDSSRPDTIKYLLDRGFKMQPSKKGKNSVADGVEFLKSFDIVIHPRCVHTSDEFACYSYKVDPFTEEVLPILEDKKNHVIDSCRYALEGLRRGRKDTTFALDGEKIKTSPGVIHHA